MFIPHFLYSHIDGRLSDFLLLASRVTLLWAWLCRYLFESRFSFLLLTCPEMELLDHVISRVIFCGVAASSSTAAAPLSLPTGGAPGSDLPVAPTLLILRAFGDSRPHGYEVVFCDLDLRFPNDYGCRTSRDVFSGHLSLLFGEVPACSGSLPTFELGCLLFSCGNSFYSGY